MNIKTLINKAFLAIGVVALFVPSFVSANYILSRVEITLETNDRVERGEEMFFEGVITNTSSQTLEDVLIRVPIENGFEFVDANNGGQYSYSDNSIIFEIENLSAKESEEFSFSLLSTEDLGRNGSLQAKAVYTGPNEEQGDATAFAILEGRGIRMSDQAALALYGGNSFLPDSILDWVILIIIIYFGILIYRRVVDEKPA